ncbi:ECF transporter S component [Candidatus Xianfuyuplasma coldseepsis]|uniref:ECF transporter S component n=1 Tax=Candidatus Xianfuyuplasma coldseepsis TaxID=2782163 RepID=A0A7L7KRU4_9MOLU|nr:ECF transporter S component [Xianfuyuplasma coldseepsis]QMS85541.1 ECF transporter S component [Xianfuyuplasma coldseepsis]
MNMKTRELTLTAVLSAIVLVMALVPNFGFINVNAFVGFTIIHIPILVGAYYGGRKVGGFLGALFGITSLFVAFTRPTSLLDPVFTNPIVSVLPRFLIGFFAYDVLKFFRKLVSNEFLQNGLFFGVMTLFHSLLVIPLMYIVAKNNWFFDVYDVLNRVLETEVGAELTQADTIGTIDFIASYFLSSGTIFGFIATIFIFNSLLEIAVAIVVGVPVANRLNVVLNNQE